jgi:hypothetical protein
MSSSAKPQWGHRPEGREGGYYASPFEDDFVQRVARAYGITDAERLGKRLNQIAVQKTIFEDIEKSEVPTPNQRAALAVMIEEAQSLLDGGVRGKRPGQHNPTIGRSQAAS